MHQVTGTQEGQILVGKYRVDGVLGAGEMGTVFAAHHLQLDTRVAVKVLRPSLLTNPEAVSCFTREARAAIRLGNEHATRVFDVGTTLTGAPYMVMEFLEGADLGTLLQKQGRFNVQNTVDFVLQACEAIAEAHSLGIVHRDLKPANLFCIRRADGRPMIKVLDFGISKATGVAAGLGGQSPRQTPVVAGTPFYMSPEQFAAPRSVDERTDIWALGVILYELLTGKKPFHGDSLPEVSVEIATSEPKPLRTLVPDLPDKLATVIDVCLAKDRERRYPNVAELAWALWSFGPRRARAAAEKIADILQVPGTAPGQPSVSGSFETSSNGQRSVARMPPTSSKKRMLAVVGGVGLVGVLTFAYASVERRARLRSPDLSGTTLVVPRKEAAPTALVVPASFVPATVAPTNQGLTNQPPRPDGRDVTSRGAAPPVAKASARRLVGSPVGLAGKKLDCSQTFDLDDQGRKRFKAECMKSAPGPSTSVTEKRPGCDQNFDLDDQGRKHFKPECFLGAP